MCALSKKASDQPAIQSTMQNFNQPTLRPPHAPSRPRCDHPPSRPSSLLPPHHSTSRPPLSVTVLLRYVVDVTPHRSSLLLLLLLLLLVSSRCCHHCRSPITDPPPSCHRVTISRHFLARCITIRYGHHQPIHPSSSLSSSLSSSSSSSSSLSSSLSSSSLSSSSSSFVDAKQTVNVAIGGQSLFTVGAVGCGRCG